MWRFSPSPTSAMASLICWANRMPHDAIVLAEQRYLRPFLDTAGNEYVLLAGEAKPLSWLPGTPSHAVQVASGLPASPAKGWIKAHLSALPLRENAVKLAVVPYLLEFCDEPDRLLQELFRILSPEGSVLLLGFHRWHPWCWVHAPRAFRRLFWWRLKTLAQEAGFSVTPRYPFHYGALYAVALKKRLVGITPLKPSWKEPVWESVWQPTTRKAMRTPAE